jgi:hypothetical protein
VGCFGFQRALWATHISLRTTQFLSPESSCLQQLMDGADGPTAWPSDDNCFTVYTSSAKSEKQMACVILCFVAQGVVGFSAVKYNKKFDATSLDNRNRGIESLALAWKGE